RRSACVLEVVSMFRKLLPVIALLVSCAGLLGQDSRGSILGVVTDTSAAVVAGATVTAVNVATNIAIVATTNMEGRYEIPYLLPGTYRVTAEMSGFKATIRDGIEVSVNSRLTIDMRMELGAATESVTVTAETPLLENSTAS